MADFSAKTDGSLMTYLHAGNIYNIQSFIQNK